MSLLHDVFRPPQAELEAMRVYQQQQQRTGTEPVVVTVDGEEPSLSRPRSLSPPAEGESSSDEEVGVTSHSTTPSRTRAPSPTRGPSGASSRPAPKPLLLSSSKTDPFRRLNTELVIRILGMLGPADLARCSEVCRKWANSQAANFVWFRLTRQGNFHDDSPAPLLPPSAAAPTWTKKQSKQNWRKEYSAQQHALLASSSSLLPPLSRSSSRPASPFSSGYQTPREIREEQWAREADGREKLTKVEMREMYKELGGRKARGKGVWDKGARDRTGWVEDVEL